MISKIISVGYNYRLLRKFAEQNYWGGTAETKQSSGVFVYIYLLDLSTHQLKTGDNRETKLSQICKHYSDDVVYPCIVRWIERSAGRLS